MSRRLTVCLLLPTLLPWLAVRAQEPEAPMARPDFSQFNQMIERPLFSNTRRPAAVLDAPTESLDAQKLREVWRLSGIVLENDQQMAIFSERQGELRLRLEVGMALADEWRLRRIERDRVWLGNDGTEVELLLREPQAHQEPDKADKAEKPPKAPAGKEKPDKPANAPADKDKSGKPAAPPAPAPPGAPSSTAPPKGRTALVEPVRRG